MKILITVTGKDVDQLNADNVAETLFFSLDDDGYDILVTGEKVDD